MIALAAHRRQTIPSREEAGVVTVALASQPAALALDHLDQSVFILGADLRLQFASAAAKRLVKTGRMSIRSEMLCSPIAAETVMLRRLVTERIAAAALGQTQMVFHRLDGTDDPLCLGVTAARQTDESRLGPPVAIVLASKPSEISLPDLRQLRDHFGLTEAQARLAIEITKGHGLAACARRLGIAVTTARSHLRQIFAKTNTKRQAEFVGIAYACRLPVRAICEA